MKKKIITFFAIFAVTLSISSIFKIDSVKADEFKKLRNEHAAMLRQTEKNWISWRYFNDRLMFYTSALQGMRCGIDEGFWGISSEKIDKDLQIGKPDENSGTDAEIALAKMLYEENINGCDPEDPFAVRSIIIYQYVDEINEAESDSLIGLDSETQSIKSIWVKIKFADKKKFKIVEFPIPKKVLREIEVAKILKAKKKKSN